MVGCMPVSYLSKLPGHFKLPSGRNASYFGERRPAHAVARLFNPRRHGHPQQAGAAAVPENGIKIRQPVANQPQMRFQTVSRLTRSRGSDCPNAAGTSAVDSALSSPQGGSGIAGTRVDKPPYGYKYGAASLPLPRLLLSAQYPRRIDAACAPSRIPTG